MLSRFRAHAERTYSIEVNSAVKLAQYWNMNIAEISKAEK